MKFNPFTSTIIIFFLTLSTVSSQYYSTDAYYDFGPYAAYFWPFNNYDYIRWNMSYYNFYTIPYTYYLFDANYSLYYDYYFFRKASQSTLPSEHAKFLPIVNDIRNAKKEVFGNKDVRMDFWRTATVEQKKAKNIEKVDYIMGLEELVSFYLANKK